MTHTWRWRKYPADSWDQPGTRKGQRCRVLIVSKGPGPKNCLVEFEDGDCVVVTNAARRFAMLRDR